MRKKKKTGVTSRMLKNRQAVAAELKALEAGLLRESDPGLHTGLTAFLAAGETLPDLRLLGVLAVRRAQRWQESFLAAQEARRATRAALREARREREHAAALLFRNLRRLRDLSRGCFGRGTVRLAPGGWAIPRSPAELLHFAGPIGERLRDPAFTWPVGAPARVAAAPGELAAEIEEPAGELRAALCRLEEKVVEERAAREARDRTADRFDSDFRPSVRFLDSLAVLAGRSGLDEWILPGKGHG